MAVMRPLPDSVIEAIELDDEYERLPEPIKMIVSRKEYLWLTDERRANLIQEECDPEW